MTINKDIIAKLNPCKNRFNNYLLFYKDENHTFRQFMGLKNITHEDKLWVAFRLIDKAKLRFAAADIAELVLPIFEAEYPNDNRPKLAIEASRGNVASDTATRAAVAAGAAAYTAADAYAYSAARAADAAAYSAYSVARVADAVYSAVDTAYAATRTATIKTNIEKKIRTILLRYLK